MTLLSPQQRSIRKQRVFHITYGYWPDATDEEMQVARELAAEYVAGQRCCPPIGLDDVRREIRERATRLEDEERRSRRVDAALRSWAETRFPAGHTGLPVTDVTLELSDSYERDCDCNPHLLVTITYEGGYARRNLVHGVSLVRELLSHAVSLPPDEPGTGAGTGTSAELTRDTPPATIRGQRST